MNNQPSFSIVIPTYNRAAFISRAIRTLLEQAVTDFEIIVVDDGSTDNTDAVVSEFVDARVRYFWKVNKERAAARNFGVEHSSGRYISFLDSDDYVKPHHLTEAQKVLRANPQCPVFSLGYDIVAADDKVIYPWKPLPDPANEKLIEGNFLSCMGVFIRRDIMLANLFNEDRDLSGSEDYELWLRIAARYPIRAIPVSTSCLVNHDSRSVVTISVPKLVRRIDLLKGYIETDSVVKAYYGEHLKQVNSFLDLYLALHLTMAQEKKLAIQTLWHAIATYGPVFFNFRFWVVIKKIIFN